MHNNYWRDAEDDENLICRSVSVDGRIHVGLYRVLFGWRVRGGWVKNKLSVELDWCCGDDHRTIIIGYKLMLAVLQAAITREDPFWMVPQCSEIKPFNRDTRFFVQLLNQAEHDILEQLQELELPDFSELNDRANKQFQITSGEVS